MRTDEKRISMFGTIRYVKSNVWKNKIRIPMFGRIRSEFLLSKNKGRIPMFGRITFRILIIGKIFCRIKIVGRKTRNLNDWSDAS